MREAGYYHVYNRGCNRQPIFLDDDNYVFLLRKVKACLPLYDLTIIAYCLMPNHVHLIAVPSSEEGLGRAIGEAHCRYTRRINFREKWRGYLWQGRFASFVMDEPHLLAAARYVELNPVRAKLVERPREWPWSSARAHLAGRDDRLVRVAPLLAMIDDWRGLLSSAIPEEELTSMREHGQTGRPLGNAAFVDRLEKAFRRVLHPRKSGRPSILPKQP